MILTSGKIPTVVVIAETYTNDGVNCFDYTVGLFYIEEMGTRFVFAMRKDTHKTSILPNAEGYKKALEEIGIEIDDYDLGFITGRLAQAKSGEGAIAVRTSK